MSDFVVSSHTREEMERRGLDAAAVEAVVRQPEQVVPGHGELRVYQSRVYMEGREYLLRAVVNDTADPNVAVTVYRTRSVSKYWRDR